LEDVVKASVCKQNLGNVEEWKSCWPSVNKYWPNQTHIKSEDDPLTLPAVSKGKQLFQWKCFYSCNFIITL
jgi:hypothetical protein